MLISLHSFPWVPAIAAAAYLFVKRRGLGVIVEKTLETMIGYFLILVGAELSVAALSGLDSLLFGARGIHGGVQNTEVFGSILLRDYGIRGFLTFLLAFLVNVLLARRSRRAYLFLTGHHLFFLSLMAVFLVTGATALPGAAVVLVSGAAVGVYAYAAVRVSAPVMSRLKPDGAGLANSAVFAALLAAGTGRLAGGGRGQRAEAPGGRTSRVNFTVLGVLCVWTVFLVLSLLAGQRVDGGLLWTCSVAALQYGAAVTLLLLGIRMFLGVFIQMFWDIGGRLAPRLVIGLDASAIISYSPRAWWTGFVSTSISAVLACALMVALRAPYVPLPGLTSYYFSGGVAGVFGSLYGGKRGALTAGVVVGLATIGFNGLLMAQGGGVYAGLGASFGETDYGIFGSLLLLLLQLFSRA